MFNSNWYNNLIKPPFAPPNFIFAPVWAILYLLIFLALVLYILKSGNTDSAYEENKRNGYIAFTVQILLNLAWSPVFFGLKNIPAAFAIIIFLDLFVILTVKKFYTVSKFSGIILIPYLIWILFATYLNLGYLILNPSV